MTQLIILNETIYFEKHQLVEGKKVPGGYMVKDHFITESACVKLEEKIEKADEEKIRKIVREMLRKMFWRMYTRSAFIVK